MISERNEKRMDIILQANSSNKIPVTFESKDS